MKKYRNHSIFIFTVSLALMFFGGCSKKPKSDESPRADQQASAKELEYQLDPELRKELFKTEIKKTMMAEDISTKEKNIIDHSIDKDALEDVLITERESPTSEEESLKDESIDVSPVEGESSLGEVPWIEEAMLLRVPEKKPRTVYFTPAMIREYEENFAKKEKESQVFLSKVESLEPSIEQTITFHVSEEEALAQETGIPFYELSSGAGIALSPELLALAGVEPDDIVIGRDSEGREIRIKDIDVTVQGEHDFSKETRERLAAAVRAFPQTLKRAGPIVDFGPHGATFEEPIYIKIPYTPESLHAAGVNTPYELKVYYFDEEKKIWTDEGIVIRKVDMEEQIIYAEVLHF